MYPPKPQQNVRLVSRVLLTNNANSIISKFISEFLHILTITFARWLHLHYEKSDWIKPDTIID